MDTEPVTFLCAKTCGDTVSVLPIERFVVVECVEDDVPSTVFLTPSYARLLAVELVRIADRIEPGPAQASTNTP